MGKILGWVVVALLIWVAWKLWAIGQRRRSERDAARTAQHADPSGPAPGGGSPGSTRSDPDPGVERMVRCAHCDLHLPASQARFASGKAFCSEEHQRLSRS